MAAEPRLLANAIRALAMDAVQAANSGHPGMPMGMADVATTLFTEYLKYDPADPAWHDRDRFVLSAGHGSMLIYALLHLTGYAKPTMDDIRNFRQLGSPCAGHPENFLLPGVEATTGPLGQGFGMAVGMAIAERHLNAVYGDDLVDHRTWVVAGDGDLMEGVNHEAAGLAGHLKLGRLIVFWDDNRITIDGSTDLSRSEDVLGRYRAAEWHTVSCDGHDFADIRRAIDEALADDRPSLIACRTIIGWGAPNKQGTAATHGSALGADEVAAARKQLVWESAPFEIPDPILSAWREAGQRSAKAHEDWRARLAADPEREEFVRRMEGRLPDMSALQRLYRRARRQPAEGCDAQGVGAGARGDQPGAPGHNRRFGGPHRLEQYQDQGTRYPNQRGLFRPLPLLRNPRVRNGLRDERNGAAWRCRSLRRNLSGFLRLLPPRHPPRRPPGDSGRLPDDPRFDRPRRGWADPPAGRAYDQPQTDPESCRLPSGRCGRDGGMLGAVAGAARRSVFARAHAPEPAAASHGGEPEISARAVPIASAPQRPGAGWF